MGYALEFAKMCEGRKMGLCVSGAYHILVKRISAGTEIKGATMATTIVYELETGEQQTFTCPPRRAVLAASEQARGNFNTWEYPYLEKRVQESSAGYFCGTFWARKKEVSHACAE